MDEMLPTLDVYVKLAVDIQRGILAGGGALHGGCESALLEDGRKPEDIWEADWNPRTRITSLSTTSVRKFVPPLNSSPNPLLLGREGGFRASPSSRLFSPSLRKRGGRGVSFGGGGTNF